MGRFLTRSFVATDAVNAKRLSKIDGTPTQQVRYAPDAQLLHRSDTWAWWSDQIVTGVMGLPDDLLASGLSTAAVKLITYAKDCHPRSPACGWVQLSQVQKIRKKERLVSLSCPNKTWWRKIERLTLSYLDGSQGTLYQTYAADQRFLMDYCDFNVQLPIDRLMAMEPLDLVADSGVTHLISQNGFSASLTALESAQLMGALSVVNWEKFDLFEFQLMEAAALIAS